MSLNETELHQGTPGSSATKLLDIEGLSNTWSWIRRPPGSRTIGGGSLHRSICKPQWDATWQPTRKERVARGASYLALAKGCYRAPRYHYVRNKAQHAPFVRFWLPSSGWMVQELADWLEGQSGLQPHLNQAFEWKATSWIWVGQSCHHMSKVSCVWIFRYSPSSPPCAFVVKNIWNFYFAYSGPKSFCSGQEKWQSEVRWSVSIENWRCGCG